MANMFHFFVEEDGAEPMIKFRGEQTNLFLLVHAVFLHKLVSVCWPMSQDEEHTAEQHHEIVGKFPEVYDLTKELFGALRNWPDWAAVKYIKSLMVQIQDWLADQACKKIDLVASVAKRHFDVCKASIEHETLSDIPILVRTHNLDYAHAYRPLLTKTSTNQARGLHAAYKCYSGCYALIQQMKDQLEAITPLEKAKALISEQVIQTHRESLDLHESEDTYGRKHNKATKNPKYHVQFSDPDFGVVVQLLTPTDDSRFRFWFGAFHFPTGLQAGQGDLGVLDGIQCVVAQPPRR